MSSCIHCQFVIYINDQIRFSVGYARHAPPRVYPSKLTFNKYSINEKNTHSHMSRLTEGICIEKSTNKKEIGLESEVCGTREGSVVCTVCDDFVQSWSDSGDFVFECVVRWRCSLRGIEDSEDVECGESVVEPLRNKYKPRAYIDAVYLMKTRNERQNALLACSDTLRGRNRAALLLQLSWQRIINGALSPCHATNEMNLGILCQV